MLRNKIYISIQIQHLLKLNTKWNHSVLIVYLNSNTTLVKVKYLAGFMGTPQFAWFKYNTC